MSDSSKDVQAIFFAAMDLSPADREKYLQRECGGDHDLRERVVRLLSRLDGPSEDIPEQFVEYVTPKRLDEALKQNAKETPRDGVTPRNHAPPPSDDHPSVTLNGGPERSVAPAGHPEIPGYHIIGEIARGGMGVVYRALQREADRVVALKMILAPSHGDETTRARFRTEAQAIARLQHPNIVQIFEVGEHNGRAYFSLEFCPEGSLADYLDGTPLPSGEAARLVRDLCGAVSVAHGVRIIHRDLKPANILLTPRPEGKAADLASHNPKQERPPLSSFIAKVTDFGLAKQLDGEERLTQTGLVMGTPSYMSPEQVKAGSVGREADIYALGAILYESLTGRPPFMAATAVETVMQVKDEEPLPPRQFQPAVPRDLETVCLKCLRKEPQQRYRTADELRDDLERHLDGRPIQARPVGRAERAWRWCRRHPARAGLALTLGLFLVSLVGGAIWYFRQQAAWARVEAGQAQAALKERQRRGARLRRIRAAVAQARQSRESLRISLAEAGGVFELLDRPDVWRGHLNQTRLRIDEARDLFSRFEGVPTPGLGQDIRSVEREVLRDEANLRTALAFDSLWQDQFQAGNVDNDKGPLLARLNSLLLGAGLDLKNGTAAKLAAGVRRSDLRELLVASIANWAYLYTRNNEGDFRDRLVAILRQAGTGGQNGLLFTADGLIDKGALKRLAGDIAADRGRFDRLSPQVQFLIGARLWQLDGDAAPWLRQAQALHPENFQLNFALGLVLGRGDPGRAVGFYRAALVKRPSSSVIYSNMAGCFHALGDHDRALAYNNKAIQLDPKNWAAKVNAGGYHRELKQWRRAVDAYRSALKLGRESEGIYLGLGDAFVGLRDWQMAIKAYRKLTRLSPDLPEAHHNLGVCYARMNKWADALPYLQKATELNPQDASSHFYHGIALSKLGDAGGAVSALRRSLEAAPNDAITHYNLAFNLRRTGSLDGATTHYKRALALSPRFVEAYRGLAITLSRQGNHRAAIAQSRKAVALAPGSTDTWLEFSAQLIQARHFAEAEEAVRKAIAINPRAPKPWFNLAMVLVRTSRLDRAIQAAERGLGLLPDGDPVRGQAVRQLKNYQSLQRMREQIPKALKSSESVDTQTLITLIVIADEIAQRHADAARLSRKLFTAAPKFAADLAGGHRYDAACYAALAAADDSLPTEDRGDFRRQALDWLGQDFRARVEQKSEHFTGPVTLAIHIRRMADDGRLATVRSPKSLARLPQPERDAWAKFWQDFRAAKRQSDASFKTKQFTGTLSPEAKQQSHPVKLDGGKVYWIELHSTEFNSTLRIQNMAGETVLENQDIGPEDRNSRLIFRPERGGTYQLVAGSEKQIGRGAYRLILNKYTTSEN